MEKGEKEIGGLVFSLRSSNPVWVEPGSLGVIFAYCLPGEFTISEQKILGGSEVTVRESYAIALPSHFMVWLMVVENQHRDNRLPAAPRVICGSDDDIDETRVVSPQVKLQINNIYSNSLSL